MITPDNYYSLNNRGLSQSKIKLYNLCPNYFYRSVISGEVIKKDTKSFMIGRESDSILTEMNKFQNTIISPYADFRTKEAREWREDQELAGKTVVKENEYEQIMAIAINVSETSIWKDIEKNFVMQDILQVPDNTLGEYFDCRYGKPDAYKIDKDGVCILLDLKTSVSIDKRKFWHKANDLGYFKQLRWYSDLLQKLHPKIKSFKYYFVVAEKAEPYRVVLFDIPNSEVDGCAADLQETVTKISNDKDFKKKDVTWSDSITLTPFDEVEDWEDVDE